MRAPVDAETLRRLDFDRIVAELVGRTHFAPGAEDAARTAPLTDREALEELQEETAQARSFLERQGAPPLRGLRDVREPVARARRGGSLEPGELLDVAQAVEALGALRRALSAPPAGERLRRRAAEIPDLEELGRSIRRAIADDATVRDDASPELRRLRQRCRELRAELRQRLEAFIRSPAVSPYLQEPLVTFREGRAVVPVRAEHRARVEGIVHDVSHTGATVFVEPAFAVELGNRLREAEVRERREVARVLASLSAAVGQRGEALLRGLDQAAQLDAIFARARLALDQRAVRPVFTHERRVELRGARHPLLGEAAVPIDIRLGGDFDTLVITGPNTGGKTVALKTLGLLCLMAQAGLQVPAERAELAVFRQVFADIGDEQSLEQSLSTFAAHMRTLIAVLERADPHTLVLIDELGAGTDPEEGAALGLAILDALRRRGALVAVSTHIGRVKVYAYEQPGVASASVEFDPETLQPTYRLRIGVPGRSHALTVARRLGLDEEVLRRAQAYLGEPGARVDDAIARLEQERRRLEQELAEAARARAEAERLRAELHRRVEAFEAQRRQWLASVRAELTARLNRLQEEAERLTAELRATAARAAERGGSGEGAGPHAAPAELLARLKGLRAEAAEVLAGAEPAPHGPGSLDEPAVPQVWQAGMPVWIKPLGQVGILAEEVRPGRPAVVQAGALRMQVRLEDLVPAPGAAAPTEAPGHGSPGGGETRLLLERARTVQPELHLRGLTVEEALERLDRYLDEAVLAGLARARIVHGKGTGALRAAVHGFLRGDRRVRSFRLGGPGEGGTGVTVVEIDA